MAAAQLASAPLPPAANGNENGNGSLSDSEKDNEKDDVVPEASSPKPLGFAPAVDEGDPRMALSRKNVAAAKADKTGRIWRLYCDGIFDLFHVGHMRMLEQAKKSFGDAARVHLIAGINTDIDTHKYKGKTVMNHRTRCDSVRHCKWVDEVVEDAPWIVDEAFLDKYNIDFVCHDALPYKDTSGISADGDVYSGLKKIGKFLETQRTEGISTSDLIITICRDYDDYIRRNLDRGYTEKELGVGRTWAVRAEAHDKKKKVDTSVTKVRTEMGELSVAARDFVRQFHPKWLVDREGSGAAGNMRFTPKIMAEHIRAARGKSSAVFHHSIGLAKAVFELSWTCLSYVVPCCYCGFLCKKKKKQK